MEQFVRARLLQMQNEFRLRIAAIQRDLQSLVVGEYAQKARLHENDEVLHHLLDEAEIELGRVNQALHRMQEGRYGQCIRCGEAISQARLVAVPQTDICHACARHENELAQHH